MTTKITYSPRETAPQGTRVTSWWIDGSRDRYGKALFITESTLFTRSGAEQRMIHLWENNRPYGTNVEISKTLTNHRPETWSEIDKMLHPSVVRFDPWSGNA